MTRHVHPAVRLRWLALCGVAMITADCQRHVVVRGAGPAPRYTVGLPWQGQGGAWFYPKEQFDLHQTGLAIVELAHTPPLTSDGERYDPAALAGQHQTLQLPAVLRVTNLENGRRLLIRVNDRGPQSPGRVLALTPAAANRLGMSADTATRVAVDLDPELSRAVAAEVAGGPHLDLVAAPVEGVQEQSLGAPGQPGPNQAAAVAAPATPDRLGQPVASLSTTVEQGPADPRALWIDAGRFGERGLADQVATAVDGRIDSDGSGRETVYNVRIGPFQHASDADAALDRARRAGVTGARIIVE